MCHRIWVTALLLLNALPPTGSKHFIVSNKIILNNRFERALKNEREKAVMLESVPVSYPRDYEQYR